MYGGTANDKINAHLKKFTPGNLQNETMYAVPVPIMNVKNNTPISKTPELNIYSIKKVFFKIS